MNFQITERIRSINLFSVLNTEGVELKRAGNKFIGLCPFHTEKNPSFTVFPDNRAKCFGCGWYGSPVDFIMALHGLSFKEALSYLGISQEPLSIKDKQKIQGQKRRLKLINRFRQWERDAVFTFSRLVRTIGQLTEKMTPDEFENNGYLLDQVPYLEHCLDVLCSGDDEQKMRLYRQCKSKGIALRRRRSLFKEGFDYKKWLREVQDG
jgi:DNA primase